MVRHLLPSPKAGFRWLNHMKSLWHNPYPAICCQENQITMVHFRSINPLIDSCQIIFPISWWFKSPPQFLLVNLTITYMSMNSTRIIPNYETSQQMWTFYIHSPTLDHLIAHLLLCFPMFFPHVLPIKFLVFSQARSKKGAETSVNQRSRSLEAWMAAL